MQKGILTDGALDNLDHNPLSTTAQGLFHGTIIQQPTDENPGIYRTKSEFEIVETNKQPLLPGSYVTVPAVSAKVANISVHRACTNLETGQCISWGPYHATMQSEPINSTFIMHYPRTYSGTPKRCTPTPPQIVWCFLGGASDRVSTKL